MQCPRQHLTASPWHRKANLRKITPRRPRRRDLRGGLAAVAQTAGWAISCGPCQRRDPRLFRGRARPWCSRRCSGSPACPCRFRFVLVLQPSYCSFRMCPVVLRVNNLSMTSTSATQCGGSQVTPDVSVNHQREPNRQAAQRREADDQADCFDNFVHVHAEILHMTDGVV